MIVKNVALENISNATFKIFLIIILKTFDKNKLLIDNIHELTKRKKGKLRRRNR